MLVRVSAFDVELESEVINLEALVDNLVDMNGVQEGSREYYFDVQSFPGFCVGVVITIKDQKSYCTLGADGEGGHVIKVNGLEEGNSIMDFNFFVLNLDNGIGVYQHYHQSASISSLGKKFKDGLSDLKESLIDAEIARQSQAKRGDISKHAKAKIRSGHKSKVQINTIVSRSTLAQLLGQYNKIKGMEYTYTTLSPVILHATPLADRVQRKKESITFENPSIVRTLSREIAAAVVDFNIAKGRVFVEDADGVSNVVKIFDMPETLWERDYDDVVQMIDNINVSDFQANDFLRAMVELFNHPEHGRILRARLR